MGVGLFLLAGIAWTYHFIFSEYREHQADIYLYLDELFEQLALPYRVARLTAQDELRELPVPVSGVSVFDIEDSWNMVREDGRMHEGVDIFGARNTPVFSVTEGYVLRSGKNNLGGNSVFIIGPGGVRYYYAHLERIADGIHIGEPVTKDTVIGFVGNSGNATSTPPHLHFGIYTKNGPKNPYPYLIDRE